MKQQINLYLPELRKQVTKYSALRLAQILGITMGILVLIAAYDGWQNKRLSNQIASMKREKLQDEKQLIEMKKRFPQVKDLENKLNLEISQLEKEKKMRASLLGDIDGDKMGNTKGFSEFIAGLSRQHIKGLWLTEIILAEGGKNISLNGSTNRAEYLPKYLYKLKKEDSFKGVKFSKLNIEDEKISKTSMKFTVSGKLR